MKRFATLIAVAALCGCSTSSGNLIDREILNYEFANQKYTAEELKERTAEESANAAELSEKYLAQRKALGQVKRDYALQDERKTHLTARVDGQRKANVALAANLKQLQGKETAMKGQVAQAEASLKQLAARDTALKAQIAQTQASIGKLAAQDKALRTQVAAIDTKIKQAKTLVASLTATHAASTKAQTALTTRVTGLKGQIAAMQAQEQAMRGQLASLKKTTGLLQAEKADLTKLVASRQVAVKGLRNQVASRDAEKKALEQQLAMASDQGKRITVMLHAQRQANAKHEKRLGSELKRIEKQIAALKGKQVKVPNSNMLRKLDKADAEKLTRLEQRRTALHKELEGLLNAGTDKNKGEASTD